jgi:O-antigen ligase
MLARLSLPALLGAGLIAFSSLFVGVLAGINPAFALAATFAGAFALIAFADLAAGLVVYTSIVFLQYGSLAKTLIASALVLILAAIAKTTTARQAGTQLRTLLSEYRSGSWLFAGLLAWIAVSTAWAGDPSLALVDVSRWAINLAVYSVVIVAAQTRRQAVLILGGYIVACSFVTVFGPSIRPGFLTPPTGAAELASEQALRFIGGVGDPNELAAVLLPGIALSAGAIAALRGSPALRCLAGVALAISLLAFLLTSSRGGLIGLIVGLLVAVMFAGRWRPAAVLGVLVLVISALTFFAAYASTGEQSRILAPTAGEGRAQESRLTLWQVGWRMVEANPIKGVGVGNYQPASVDYVLEPGESQRSDAVIDANQPAHNTYLHILAELGVIGFSLFAGVLIFSVACTVRAARVFRDLGDVAMEIMARTLVAGQCGMLAAIFFFSAQSVNKIWLVLALGPALLSVARGRRPVASA